MSLFVAAPHAHGARSITRIMLIVMAALTPATLNGFWHFGWPAIFLWLTTILSCLLAEALACKLAGKPVTPALADGSAVLTGWLLAISLPPWAPWWIGAVGGAFAIIVCKQAFGGLGQNLFNPAMAARVVLLISFPLEMTRWVSPAELGSAAAPDFMAALSITFGAGIPDAISSATLLDHVKTEAARGVDILQTLDTGFEPLAASLGARSGSLGETGALLLALGGVFMIAMRVIGLRIPLAFLVGVAVPAAIASQLAPQSYLPPLAHLLTGGVMLGAFFIATDYVTSPSTPLGQWLFGIGCGLLTWLIRTWGAYPEGVAFAILLMNATTPLIDHYTRPRIFGRLRDGRPLTPEAPERA